jgi:hypothetical protein
MTPIEILANLIEENHKTIASYGAHARGAADRAPRVGDVLVPEQCAEVYIGGERFHVTIERVEN